jgi:hypothetical protein
MIYSEKKVKGPFFVEKKKGIVILVLKEYFMLLLADGLILNFDSIFF